MRRNERSSSGVSIGGATIVMIFSVLCLTIFAVLSLITARNELTLAQKSADSITAYYEADLKAVEIYDALAGALRGEAEFRAEDFGVEVSFYFLDGGSYNTYSIPVDDRQELRVVLLEEEDGMSVVSWIVAENGSWAADQYIDVWDMEFF